MHKFEDFFEVDGTLPNFEIGMPRADLIKELSEDFELFVNETEMGKNYVNQLIEARDGSDEKKGIGKVYVSEHSHSTANLVGADESVMSVASSISTPMNGERRQFISFNTALLDTPQEERSPFSVNKDGELHEFSATEYFFHELKHAVDEGYVELDRETFLGHRPLNEFDAVSFSVAVRRAIEEAEYQPNDVDLESNLERDAVVFGFEQPLLAEKLSHDLIHEEGRTDTGYRILKENGLDDEAQILHEENPAGDLGFTIGADKQDYRDMVLSEKHNTSIGGKPKKWVDVVAQDNSSNKEQSPALHK